MAFIRSHYGNYLILYLCFKYRNEISNTNLSSVYLKHLNRNLLSMIYIFPLSFVTSCVFRP